MHLSGNTILEHISNAFNSNAGSFPRGGKLNYPVILKGWIAGLESAVLPYVTAGGISKDSGHLTQHDQEHFERVLQVATDLVRQSGVDISSYELVQLILAVYLHDLGNILGRAGHEGKVGKVLEAAGGSPSGMDNIEMNCALQIARVHGGRAAGGSKDTIGSLPKNASVANQSVRLQFLAAIVRLADELADDPARANRVQLGTGSLTPVAEVYHQYARHLHTMNPNAAVRTIEIEFTVFDPKLFTKKLGKGTSKVYLLEEILARSLKTYLEARYCSRFLHPSMDFNRVKVSISVFASTFGQELVESISFELAESGYPEWPKDVYAISPELLKFRNGGKLTGARFAQILKAGAKSQ